MFNEILKKLMAEKNISNYRLAKDISVSNSTIANWLNGTAHPNNERLQKLSDYFAVPVDYLLGKTDIKNKPAENGGLTELEQKLLDTFRSLSETQQKALLYDLLNSDKK